MGGTSCFTHTKEGLPRRRTFKDPHKRIRTYKKEIKSRKAPPESLKGGPGGKNIYSSFPIRGGTGEGLDPKSFRGEVANERPNSGG